MILWRNIENYHFFIILIPTPDFPHFYYMLGANLGSLLYGDVSVMMSNQGQDLLSLFNLGFLCCVLIQGTDIRCAFSGPFPDSMTTLGQRSFSVVDSVGPTLETDVGPT